MARARGLSVRAAAHGNGIFKPRPIPGTDLAGVVEAVGKRVTRFKVGDEVFGESAKHGRMNGGAYAQYAAVRQNHLALKPRNVSFEQAAAVPTAGTIALNNLGGAERPKRETVLINGHAHYDDSSKRLLGDIPRFAALMFGRMRDREKRKSFKLLEKQDIVDVLRGLLAEGKLTPVIGKTFALHEVAAAMRCMQEGALGRVIATP